MMYVLSFKLAKLKAAAAVLAVVVAVGICAAALKTGQGVQANSGVTTPSTQAETAEQRSAFLTSFGWEISPDPLQITEVLIPTQFDKTYEAYNILQKKQGFDLTDYRGKRVKRWTYEVLNYPNNLRAKATLLIYDGKIIGGDISSAEQGQFQHGFTPES